MAAAVGASNRKPECRVAVTTRHSRCDRHASRAHRGGVAAVHVGVVEAHVQRRRQRAAQRVGLTGPVSLEALLLRSRVVARVERRRLEQAHAHLRESVMGVCTARCCIMPHCAGVGSPPAKAAGEG